MEIIILQEIWKSSHINLTPAQWALRWVWNHKEVSVVVNGMNSMDQIDSNIFCAVNSEIGSMSRDEQVIIDAVKAKYNERVSVRCSGCGYCMPCQQGVNIPKIFDFFNEASVYGSRENANLRYYGWLSKNEQATQCTKCGICKKMCPQKIDIPNSLLQAHDVLK